MKCVLSALMGCVLLCVEARVAMAQQPAMQRELLLFREVPTVITATRREQPLTQAPSAITVITAEEIRQSGATSIPELLRSVPGLDFFRISTDNVSIAARGLNRDFPARMQVLLDGLSVEEDVRGFVTWHHLFVPLEEIERIEIVRSPATAIHGDRAFAGVIHIITKSPEALKGSQVSLTVGEADTLIWNWLHAGVIGDFSYKVSGGYDRTNEFPNPTIGQTADELGREIVQGHFQVNYKLAQDAKISLSGGSSAFGNLGFVKAHYVLGDFTAQLSYDYAEGELDPERNLGNPDFRLDVYQAQLQHSLPWGRTHVLTGGITYRYSTFDAQSLGGGGEQNLLDFFLQNEWHVRQNLTLTVGVGVNVHPQAGVSASPRGSLVYSPWQDHTFRLSIGRAVRNPSVLENFLTETLESPLALPPAPQRRTVRVLGNRDLRPEEMLAYEVGYQGLFVERLRVWLDLFYYQLDQLTDIRELPPMSAQPAPAFPTVQFVNVGDGAIFGGELGLEVFITSWLKGFLNYAYKHRTGDIASMGFAPHHKANAGVTFSFPSGLSANILVHYVGEAKGVVDFTPPIARVDPYTLVNLRLGYRFKVFGNEAELSLQAFNLFNDVHREIASGGGFPGGDLIERRVSGTIRYRF